MQGFDQEAAAVVMARLASYKMELEVNHLRAIINSAQYYLLYLLDYMWIPATHLCLCCPFQFVIV